MSLYGEELVAGPPVRRRPDVGRAHRDVVRAPPHRAAGRPVLGVVCGEKEFDLLRVRLIIYCKVHVLAFMLKHIGHIILLLSSD